MPHLFISYSHEDKNLVDLLSSGLGLCGYRLWRDVEIIRGGQSLSTEVSIGIKSSTAFISIITQNFESSDWQRTELLHAIDNHIHVIPIVIDGAKSPTAIADLLAITVETSSFFGDPSAFLNLLQRIRNTAGDPNENLVDDIDMDSSDAEWDESDSIADQLSGTRWSWCHNTWASGDDMWIEFLADGKLKRSWRPDIGKWEVTGNGFVLYYPHALLFDFTNHLFQGVTSDRFTPTPERSGRLIGTI